MRVDQFQSPIREHKAACSIKHGEIGAKADIDIALITVQRNCIKQFIYGGITGVREFRIFPMELKFSNFSSSTFSYKLEGENSPQLVTD